MNDTKNHRNPFSLNLRDYKQPSYVLLINNVSWDATVLPRKLNTPSYFSAFSSKF